MVGSESKIKIPIAIVLTFILTIIYQVYAGILPFPNPGHPASEIGPGTFNCSGAMQCFWEFPANVIINGILNITGDIKMPKVIIKGDGNVSTGLNADKVDGYEAADLLAGGTGELGTYFNYYPQTPTECIKINESNLHTDATDRAMYEVIRSGKTPVRVCLFYDIGIPGFALQCFELGTGLITSKRVAYKWPKSGFHTLEYNFTGGVLEYAWIFEITDKDTHNRVLEISIYPDDFPWSDNIMYVDETGTCYDTPPTSGTCVEMSDFELIFYCI